MDAQPPDPRHSDEPALLYAEGIKLLSSPSEPADGDRAIALIEAAAAAGHADSCAKLALFECTGVNRPLDWEQALDRLQEAAELGSTLAQQQLLLLADPPCDPELPSGPMADHWSNLRSAVELAKLFHPGLRRPLCDRPWLRTLEGFAAPAECRWLIDAARHRLAAATVVAATGETTTNAVRTNRGFAFQLADMDVITEVVRRRISEATGLPLPFFESTQVLHYRPGEEFRPHHDYLDPQQPGYRAQIARIGQRIATVLVYLNDDYEGGETAFPAAGLEHRGRAGDALFLANVDRSGRPDSATQHAGKPPISGEKWVLSQWIRDRVQVPAPNR